MRIFFSSLLSIVLSLLNVTSFAQKLESKKYQLWYSQPAPNRGGDFNIIKSGGKPFDEDWENWSLPIGNGYLGASLFGRTDVERIQLTENSLSNKGLYGIGSLTSFAELYIDFNQQNVTHYVRSLDLNDGIARVNYTFEDVQYTRQYFASYPDKVLVIKLNADHAGKLNFNIHPMIPYLRNPDTSSMKDGRTGKVIASKNEITLSGNMQYYNIDYEGLVKVIPFGGTMTFQNDTQNDHGQIKVISADSAIILVSLATNYQMNPSVFTEPTPSLKLKGFPHPHQKVTNIIEAASHKTFNQLMAAHINDYQTLFSRVNVNLNSKIPTIPTDSLLANYKKGILDHYLEELYFQYGRYLLISSSRKGTLPANLQGIWSQYDVSPWTSGYWHNVNVQMNYWPVFNTNLAELFTSYSDYNEAFRNLGLKNADNYIKKLNPFLFDSTFGGNGWAIGTGASPYSIHGAGGHSGPGTGGFTTKLFWDQYDFTRDMALLRKVDYPAMLTMAKFLTKVVKETNGLYLATPSSSPEQKVNNQNYETIGCAFDQQMIYESENDIIKAANFLNDKDATIKIIQTQINKLDPIQVGWSGQIKEYREEKKYGEIGEYNHRHISQLVGLFPGTIINSKTPAWIDAARVTLNERGDISKGWSMAHRLNAWARIKDGNRAYKLYKNLLQEGTFNNLWDAHPPFQIDGNFGGTAGVAEMLLQSHEGYIEPLPALPDAWVSGRYTGLIARGNFEVSVKWDKSHAININIISKMGGICKIKYPNISRAKLTNSLGVKIPFKWEGKDIISFSTQKNQSFSLTQIPIYSKVNNPDSLKAIINKNGSIQLSWNKIKRAINYKVYIANNSEPVYTFITTAKNANQYLISFDHFKNAERATIKVTAVNEQGVESYGSLVYLVL
jgi:hypothetical protein